MASVITGPTQNGGSVTEGALDSYVTGHQPCLPRKLPLISRLSESMKDFTCEKHHSEELAL